MHMYIYIYPSGKRLHNYGKSPVSPNNSGPVLDDADDPADPRSKYRRKLWSQSPWL